jgi:hypothetical protein
MERRSKLFPEDKQISGFRERKSLVKKLNIQVFVDVIALMAGSPVEKSVFIYDDSPSGSIGKGTHTTASAVYPGQLIQWNIYPVDVQTPVWIGGITFGPQVAVAAATSEEVSTAITSAAVDVSQECTGSKTPWLDTWAGYAPLCMLPDLAYPYSLHLQFGVTGKMISVNGPQLAFPTVYAPVPVGVDSIL